MCTNLFSYSQAHWNQLIPNRRKTGFWQSTVAGIISVHSPTLFRSGTQELGESGYWTLQKVSPPRLEAVLKLDVPHHQIQHDYSTSEPQQQGVLDSEIGEQSHTLPANHTAPESQEHHDKAAVSPSIKQEDQLIQFTERQERMLTDYLKQACRKLSSNQRKSKVKRLYRKLVVRQLHRNHGLQLFSSDAAVKHSLMSSSFFTENELTADIATVPAEIVQTPDQVLFSSSVYSQARKILDRTSAVSLVPRQGHYCFLESVIGCSQQHENKTITSPFTSRVLIPCIYRSYEFTPLKVRLLQELVSRVSSSDEYHPQCLEFSYFQHHHVTSVNSFVSHFFWPVNLREYLQYPDFTVVVTYGKLIVGCGFMTPDVKVSESYISFLLVHPDFRKAGIGKVMLYHLVQSCLGKDVTLHVSVDNPAMLLYQQFGFKSEQFCLDFYDKYYPPGYHYSKHAFLMRLRR